MKTTIILSIFIGLIGASCVSPRKVEDLETRLAAIRSAQENCEEELDISEEKRKEIEEAIEEAEASLKKTKRINQGLEEDTLIMGRNYRRLKIANKDLNATLDKQVAVNKQLTLTSEQKNKDLYQQLIDLKKELEDKEKKLNERDANLSELQKGLLTREEKVRELQAAINERDSLMRTLKDRISSALLSYKGKGISVKTVGDKVHVSLEEQILFASGKYKLDKKGEKALLDLAEVLNANPDLSITVEGHTDNVPIKTSCISDNYDLSVLRGAEITRLLTQKGKVSPTRVSASGRGEHLPVADNKTADGRKKNRRIEIILSPEINKLLDMLDE